MSAEGGECAVKLKSDAHYMDGPEPRFSSMIEWMAQSYAYVRAAQSVTGLLAAAAAPKRAYLVSVQSIAFDYDEEQLRGTRALRVQVGGAREIGPITLFEAKVLTEDGQKLCSAKLKVFAE